MKWSESGRSSSQRSVLLLSPFSALRCARMSGRREIHNSAAPLMPSTIRCTSGLSTVPPKCSKTIVANLRLFSMCSSVGVGPSISNNPRTLKGSECPGVYAKERR